MARPLVAVLSVGALRHNAACIKAYAPGAKIIAMVKANAYGHGIRSCARSLEGHVDVLGVASLEEALMIRAVGVNTPIMLAEGVFSPEELEVALAHDFHVVFHHAQQIAWLQQLPPGLWARFSRSLTCWLKVNTGMNRLGLCPSTFRQTYAWFLHNPNVAKPLGIMSHLACSEDEQHPMNQVQKQAFEDMVAWAQATYPGSFMASLCNSAAIMHFPQHHYDYVRPGLALYGISPLVGSTGQDKGLMPVMTLKSRIISRTMLSPGAFVGYGCRFRAPQEMPLGVIACGYGDGYPLAAMDGTPVKVGDVICPLVGRVSMDMMTVDLTPCPQATVGQEVVLWGDGLPLEQVVPYIPHAIVYNMVTSMQNRVAFQWDKS